MNHSPHTEERARGTKRAGEERGKDVAGARGRGETGCARSVGGLGSSAGQGYLARQGYLTRLGYLARQGYLATTGADTLVNT